jgi:hypothetical protein
MGLNMRPPIECGHSTTEPWNLYIIWVTRACIYGYLSYTQQTHNNTQQHTTTLHNSTRVHKTTNVPVVFMALALLRSCHFRAQKSLDFQGPPLPMPLVMMLHPSTGTLIVITTDAPALPLGSSTTVPQHGLKRSCWQLQQQPS